MLRVATSSLRRFQGLGARAKGTGGLTSFGVATAPMRLSSSAREPSSSTTIQILDLPLDMTESKLHDTVGDLLNGYRKAEIEPGCAIHLTNEAEVEAAVKQLAASDLSLDAEGCSIVRTSMPSILLENLPSHVSFMSLNTAFKEKNVQLVHLMGGPTLQVQVVNAQDALAIVKIIEGIKIGDRKLCTRVAKIGEKHVINVANVPTGEAGLEQALQEVKGKLQEFSGIVVEKLDTTGEKLTLRYPSRNEADTKTLLGIVGDAVGVKDLEHRYAKKAAVVVRSKNGEVQQKVANLLGESMGATRVQVQPKGKGTSKRALVVGYFAGEEDAMKALNELKSVHGVAASFKRLAEPVVQVTGLPDDATEGDVLRFFGLFSPAEVRVDGASNSATVVLNSPADVKLASNSLSRKAFRGGADYTVTVSPAWERGCDLCLEVGSGTDMESTLTQLGGVGNPDKSTSPSSAVVQSPYSAFIAFKSVEDAISAADLLSKGQVEWGGGGAQGATWSPRE